MIRRALTVLFLLTTPIQAAVQTPETTENQDIGGLLSSGKKPCDEDKDKQKAVPSGAAAQAPGTGQTIEGLLGSKGDQADKKPEPARTSLGAVPAPMANCK